MRKELESVDDQVRATFAMDINYVPYDVVRMFDTSA